MEPFSPFTSPDVNGLPSWHHGGHVDRSFNDDSGYASEDPDSVPSLSSNPDIIYRSTDQVGRGSFRTRHHRAAAFVNAQWSPPAAFRAGPLFQGPFKDNWRSCCLPPPLSFEQQRNDYEAGSGVRSTAFHNSENFHRERGRPASWYTSGEHVSPLDFDKHKARVPNTLPSLNSRIQNETDRPSLSSSSIRHGSPSPEVIPEALQFRGPTTPGQHVHRGESSMRPSARYQRQHRSSSHDAQLAAAWQQLYQERTELDKEQRALKRKKERSLLQRKERPRSSRRDLSGDADGESNNGCDTTAKRDDSAGSY